MYKPKNLVLIVLTFLLGILLTLYVQRNIPSTLFSYPLMSLDAMRSFPIGTHVYPKEDQESMELFEKVGWNKDHYAVVADYKVMTVKNNKSVLMYRIRIYDDDVFYEFTVDGSWFNTDE